uniref:CG-1 domain-containing protein n=1 Tax=Stomoxys calcitrans TaxID=35570 RepID=A0A1I8NWK5_STOCA
MKLKVQGTECIYGCYVHSAILPTFHRRCYWLLQNPDIVLVHYLNVPYPDDNKMAVIAPSISLWGDKKEWTKEELVSQLKPMLSTVTSDDDSDSGNDIEISTAETVESIVCQLMEKQRLSRQAALVKQLDCGCGDASCADGKTCTHPVMRRPSLIKSSAEKRLPASNAAEGFGNNGATPNVVVGPKLYSRWLDKRQVRDTSNSMDTSNPHYSQQHHGHGHHAPTQQLTPESAIKFQIIPPHNEQQQQQQQQYRHHHYNGNTSSANHQQLMNTTRNNLIMQQQQQQQQQMHTNQTNFNQLQVNNTNSNTNGSQSLQRYNSNNSNSLQQQRFQIAKTTITAMDHSSSNSSSSTHNNGNSNNNNIITSQHHHQHQQSSATGTSSSSIPQSTAMSNQISASASTVGAGSGLDVNLLTHQQQQQQQHTTNSGSSNTNNNKTNHNPNINNNNNNSIMGASAHANGVTSATTATTGTSVSTMLQQQQQKQNDLNAINNNGSSNAATTSNNNKFTTNYNHQQQQQQHHNHHHQINTSNNNNNSILSHHGNGSNSVTNTQQQHQQQQQKSEQQFYKLSHNNNNKHQQPQQQQPPLTASASSTVEPMCMSPEHQPSSAAPSSTTAAASLHKHLNKQQPHLMMSSSDSISESSSSLSSSLSSSSQNFVDVNQKSTPTASSSTTTTTENAKMSSNNEMKTSTNNNNNNHNNNNNSNIITDNNNRNNQLEDFNNCTINKNNNPTGCAASSEASNCNNSMSIQNPSSSNQNPTTTNNVNNDNLHNNNNNNNNNNMANPGSIGFEAIETDQQHGIEQPVQHQQTNSTELHDTLGFFNETLDLSHEDIQRTLIANMPNENTLLTSLDFMNSNGGHHSNDVVGASPLAASVQCEADQLSAGAEADDEDTDDVFAHLDAFDMLVEFPELDLDDKQALSNTALEQAAAGVTAHHNDTGLESCHPHMHNNLSLYESSVSTHDSDGACDKKFLKICDYSPDWSYPEGGVKVLVAGPWTIDCHYTVLFDSQPVPTVLVQEGVLRCYCPAHEVGYATMQVSLDGFVISDSVMFEYKMSACQEAPFDANTNDCLYKFSLFNRLSTIEETMQAKGQSLEVLPASQQIFSLQGNLEDKLVSYCHQLTKMQWQNHATNGAGWTTGYKGMTLLHLAAALGYNKLVCALLTWRTENPHIILETEIDAFSQDAHGYTPLTWACSRGHLETVTLLYKWNQNALKIKNHAQQTPLDVAHVKGYKLVVSELYRLEHERKKKQSRGSLSSLSINLNKYSLSNDDGDDNPSFTVFDTSDPSQRSHDGVFLRPVAVSSNQSPPNSSRFSKRSSIDSGISMDIRSKPVKTFKDLTRLHSLDAHDNYGGSSNESVLDSIAAPINTTNTLLSPLRKMDFALCEVSTGDASPLPDKSHDDDDTSTIDNDDCCNDVVAMPNKNIDAVVGDSDAKVLTLAEHIIAAMPERIKNEADEMMVLGSPMTEPLNSESSGLNDSFMDPLLDSLPNAHFDNEFNFDFNDHTYRYHEVSTPCSSLSPASSGPLQSPASYSILGHDPSVSSPSPPPSTKQLTEFLHASSNSQYPFEADFSKLTLTDTEQRELYEAAKCIQKAYRSYKGRQKLEEQNKERTAAIVIQNYYRRYKQFAYYRQMTNAALVIQHGYRSYCRNKRFKKSQNTSIMTPGGSVLHNTDSQDSTNSQCLSSFFDNFAKQEQNNDSSPQSCTTPKETSPSGPLKRTYSQSTQNQAARKIQQFMRQSRIKLQRERAEKEKLVHQRRAEYLQNLQYQGQPEIVCPIEKS